jgi:protein TonB
MRRAVPLLLAVLTIAVAPPAPGQDLAAVDTGEVRFADAAPAGPSVAERLAEIRRRIQGAVVYPPLARLRRLEGSTLVRFEIEHDGTPRRVEVHRSSGMPTLDRAATGAVTAAAPLPWVYGRLEVPVRFRLEDR